ncbi:MAG: hypothetical protein GX107_05135 [Clostridiales bacterium]|jgi:hypothetical protein|nr:hypothetical protein [Clostridiales bacterium]
MKKRIKQVLKALCVAACAAVLAVGLPPFGGPASVDATEFPDVKGTKRYIIDNPYETVNWDTWQAYKANTHTHSDMSDGKVRFAEMIEYYYAAGYDCLSMTDHGTVNYGWTKSKSRHTIFGYQFFVFGSPKALSSSRNQAITTGSDRNGQKMIDVPLGIELNGASTDKVHINGYYADAGDGDMEMGASGVSGVITAVQKNHNKGGITHVNHVGEWSGKNYDTKFVNDFTNVFRTYSSCIGFELVNTSDGRTNKDRELYDKCLKVLAPLGRHIWGFCEDDAHEFGDVDRNAQYFWMPSNTAANVRTCMETGAFFASSKSAKGEQELNGATGTGDYPSVSRITIDDIHSQITFNIKKATKARIVADGVLIDTINCNANSDTVTFDLNNYESQINSYVRVYFTGAGGITFVQPFYLTSVPYSESTVVLNIDATDAEIKVFDSNNVLQTPYSSTRISATYVFDMEGTYTYTVSKDGYYPVSGSFDITTADLSMSAVKQIDVNIQEMPQIVFNNEVGHTPHEDKKIIDGIRQGITAAEVADIASSSNAGGHIIVNPTHNGYGTGTTIELRSVGGELIDKYTIVIYGDLDGNGIVDACDSNILSLNFYNLPLTPALTAASDVNNDGVIDARDVQMLVGFGMSLDSSLNVEQNR